MRAGRALPVIAVVAAAAAAWRLTRYEIADRSMEPALGDGDWVVALRRPRRIRRGEVVVVEHPQRPGFEIVKRVAALAGDPAPGIGIPVPPGGVWLLGDHPEAGSIDSRVLGSVPREAVRARVVARYNPLPVRRVRRLRHPG